MSKAGMKAKASIHKNPRRIFCVPTNQTPRIGPVQLAMELKKKPRMKRETTNQDTNCAQRLEQTLVGILRLTFWCAEDMDRTGCGHCLIEVMTALGGLGLQSRVE